MLELYPESNDEEWTTGRAERDGDEALVKVSLVLLTQEPFKTFPFLSSISPVEIPSLGVIYLSLLSAKHILIGEKGGIGGLRTILSRLEPDSTYWSKLGNALVEYCFSDGCLLEFHQEIQEPSALEGVLCFSRLGTELLLGLKDSPPDREEEPDAARSSRNKRIREILSQGCNGDADPEVVDIQTPRTTLRDLVLPNDLKDDLKLVVKLCQGDKASSPVMLFHGKSGTGKTFAASALAGSIRRKLCVVKLGKVLSRYVGDTERRLEQAFQEARSQNAILLLDEIDSLLYSRIYSHQSWQVTEVNTLLKLLEDPKIPVVLATNFLEKLDDAVLRRVHHLIAFPIPDIEERKALWKMELRRNKLKSTYLDLDRLGSIVLTGGLISNAVRQVKNRFVLFGRKSPVTTDSLYLAAIKEISKMGTLNSRPIPGFKV